MALKEISKRRFDALCYVRNPLTTMMSREVTGFEIFDRKLLAIIIFDLTDKDFGFIILGRDTRKLFRAIEVLTNFFATPEEAIASLAETAEQYENDGLDVYPQDDELEPPTELFQLTIKEEKQHPYFRVLKEEERFEAARNLLKEIAYSFVDVDGNYLQQFQSDGFDSRLWELFLHVYFYSAGFEVDNNHQAPDFCLNKFGYECCVEAVTVGANPDFDQPNPGGGAEIAELSQDYLPIKFGSALYNKINRKNQYWDMPHVKGKPFILAIHDYHVPADGDATGSMTWSRAGLVNYLYGMRDVVEVQDGRVVGSKMVDSKSGPIPLIEKIEFHTFGHKTIPSNFFEQPNAEHVSAVLYTNSATITTFNRMGKLAGLGSEEVKMFRTGVRLGEVEGEAAFVPFSNDVDDPDYEEAWSDGLIMYHNPNALFPVDPDCFHDISHARINPDNGELEYGFEPNHVYSSATFVFSVLPEGEEPGIGEK